MAVKAAVIGARSIGKQHAKWYAFEGADVVAFAGTSAQTVEETEQTLRQMFGFSGRGYTDVEEMLQKERPDIVSVCSSHWMHAEHSLLALRHGAHVLCEKPMVWYPENEFARMLNDAKEMVEVAKRENRLLAVNTQYVAALPHYAALYERHRGKLDRIESVFSRMDARIRGRDDVSELIWVDMGSHPLSLILRCLPAFQIAEGSLCCLVEERRVKVEFEALCGGGERVPCSILCCRVEGENLERCFGVNDFIVHMQGRNDEDGIYRSFLRCNGEEQKVEDFMHTSIKHFLAAAQGRGEVLCSGEEGLKNLELQIQVLRAFS